MGSVIRVKNVSKKFKIFYDRGDSFKERLLFRNRSRYEDRWVLKDVSLEVEKGEVLALIGHNGCGKSTLLKLLTRIYYPDGGTIEVDGRVSSLIELGAGFHPDMSGRENIYTNASIFGLTKQEIDARLDDIIEFSELREFIDNPVRTYSSGMFMRLAFAVAINVDADILLIDEILAVGDANFQSKCFDRLRELKAAGVTIVIVTHDTGTVTRFCNKAAWINEGSIISYGSASQVVDVYLSYMNGKKLEILKKEEERRLRKEAEAKALEEKKNASFKAQHDSKATMPEKETENIDYTANRFGLKHAEIEEARLLNHEMQRTTVLEAGKPCSIEIYYKVNRPLSEYVFGMAFYTLEDDRLYGNNTQLDGVRIPHEKTNGKVTFKVKSLPLLSGKYRLNVSIVDVNGTPLDFYREYCKFDVISNDKSVGYFSVDHEWEAM